MHVRDALVEDDVAADSDHYVPVVKISGGADGDDLVQDIIAQGSTVNKPDILAVRQDAMEACESMPFDGRRIEPQHVHV
jgi:hypothetical protein